MYSCIAILPCVRINDDDDDDDDDGWKGLGLGIQSPIPTGG